MNILPRLMAMTLISLMAGAQAAQVAGNDAMAGQPPMPRGEMHGRHEMGDGHGLMADLAKMKAELKLDANQAAKWQEAETTARSLHDNRRKEHDKMRALFDSEKQKDMLDLAKLDSAMQAQQEQGRQAHEAVRAKWLAVYESLNVDQKKLVSQHIKDKLARMDKMREHFKDRRPHRRAGEPVKG